MPKKNFFELKMVKATPGKVIKAFRKNFNITQQDLAALFYLYSQVAIFNQ